MKEITFSIKGQIIDKLCGRIRYIVHHDISNKMFEHTEELLDDQIGFEIVDYFEDDFNLTKSGLKLNLTSEIYKQIHNKIK